MDLANRRKIKGLRLLIAFIVVFARRIHLRQFAAACPRGSRLENLQKLLIFSAACFQSSSLTVSLLVPGVEMAGF